MPRPGDVMAYLEYEWRLGSSPLVARARRWADETTRRPRAAWLTTSADDSLSIGYSGFRSGVSTLYPFVAERLSQAEGNAETRQVMADRASAFSAAATDADILLVCDTMQRVARLPTQRSLVLPGRVHQIVATGANAKPLHKSDRQRFAKQRRENQWTWERATRDSDFDFFFDRMHEPMVRERYHEFAVSEKKETARESLFRRGMLFFLLDHGTRVGGVVCRLDRRHNVLRGRLNGILDGDDRWRRSGVLTGIYHFMVAWAGEQGISGVDLSGSVPFVSRGVYQTKRHLHPDVVIAQTPNRHLRYWLHIKRDTEAVRDFLVANPTLATTGTNTSDLRCVYFTDSSRPPRLDLQSGVADNDIVDLDMFLSSEPVTTGTHSG